MGEDPRAIRHEIEVTRARMGDTVEALGYKADVPARVKDAVNDRVETVKESIGDAVGGVMDGMQQATRSVGRALGGASESVSGRLGDTVGAVGDRLPDVSDARNAARRGVDIAQENPLGLALGALAVGFLAGLLAPVTDLERERVGPLRDDLLRRAQDAGTEMLQHGKQVVSDVAQSAMQTAQQSTQAHAREVADNLANGTP